MSPAPGARKESHLSTVVTGVVIVGTLYLAKVVFIPLALALLLSFLLTPVVALLERIRLPRGVAIFIVMGSLCAAIALLGWKTSSQFVDLTTQLPGYKSALLDKIHRLKGPSSQTLDNVSQTVRELENAISTNPADAPLTSRNKAPQPGSSESHPMAVEVVPPVNPVQSFQSMLGPLATAGIILVFTIFMLLDREDLRDRFIRVAGGGRLTAMTQALDEATRRINRYLLLQMVVNILYGVVIGAGLHLIGIPNASLWGVAATLLRFLPYAGPPLAATMPIFLSLAIFNDWRHALETAGLFFVLEVVVSNFVEPLLYGAHVGLSALAILVAAIFWTLIWGIPGLLLSTPLTVFLVVMGRYVPSLTFLDVLLGDEPVLPPHQQFYQRLLASDLEEARHILEAYLKEKPLEEVYSDVVIPALSMAEQDRHSDDLDDSAQVLMYQNIRDLVEEFGEMSSEQSPQAGKDASASMRSAITEEGALGRAEILCIPARDEADDVVAFMLAQLLEGRGFRAQSVPMDAISEMLAQVAEARPQIVCISALPPFAISHARELYRRLRRMAPEMRIVIGLWHLEGDLQKMAVRLKMNSGDAIFSTLPQALGYVQAELATQLHAMR
jgi:predicted PurR-regulated permease PerM